MKIYQLANDLGVDKNALFSFAQKQGIEAKSIVSELTSDEVDKLLHAFDEAGGILAPSEEMVKTQNKEVEKLSKTQPSFLKKLFSTLGKYEKQEERPKIPEVKTVKEGAALRIYRVVAFLVVAFFIGIAYSAYNTNVQMTSLTKKVNETTQTLNMNQKSLLDQNKKLSEQVKSLENNSKKVEQTSKKSDKQDSKPKPKVETNKNKK